MPLSGKNGWGGGGDKAANPCRRITARAIDATTATPPQQPSTICHSSSATVTTERDHGARGTTSAEGASQGNDERVGGGGRGAASAATPALPVEARGGHRHRLCRFPTVANIRDHGATRGTTSAEGGGRGAARATTQTHPVDVRAIDTALPLLISDSGDRT